MLDSPSDAPLPPPNARTGAPAVDRQGCDSWFRPGRHARVRVLPRLALWSRHPRVIRGARVRGLASRAAEMRAVRECERSEYSLVSAYALTQLATHLLSGPFFLNRSFRSHSIRVPSPQP